MIVRNIYLTILFLLFLHLFGIFSSIVLASFCGTEIERMEKTYLYWTSAWIYYAFTSMSVGEDLFCWALWSHDWVSPST